MNPIVVFTLIVLGFLLILMILGFSPRPYSKPSEKDVFPLGLLEKEEKLHYSGEAPLTILKKTEETFLGLKKFFITTKRLLIETQKGVKGVQLEKVSLVASKLIFSAGRKKYKLEPPPEAISIFEKIKNPRPQEAATLAKEYLEEEMPEAALYILKRTSPTMEIDLLKTRCYLLLGKYKEAENLLRNILMKKPLEVQARSLLVELYLNTGEVEKAEEEINRALEIDPSHWDVRKALILLMIRRGEIEAAIKKLKERHTDKPEYYLLLSKLYTLGGDLYSAYKTLKAGLRHFDSNYQILKTIITLSIKINPSETVSFIKKYERLFPYKDDLPKIIQEGLSHDS